MTTESRKRNLDPWVFYAIVHVESHWHPEVANWKEPGGACSIGLGGILVPGCRHAVVRPLFNPFYNLRRSAEIQQMHMRRSPNPNTWVWFYNRSSSYVGLVLQTAREAQRDYAEKPSLGHIRG